MTKEKMKATYEARIVKMEQQMKAALNGQGSSIKPERELQNT